MVDAARWFRGGVQRCLALCVAPIDVRGRTANKTFGRITRCRRMSSLVIRCTGGVVNRWLTLELIRVTLADQVDFSENIFSTD